MIQKITEHGFGTGAIQSPRDRRDYNFHGIAGAVEPFDWNTGYDIEQKLNIKLIIKNQGSSYSCGGQAWSYYGEVLSTVFDKVYDTKSAKFIYAQTFAPNGGGSNGRDNCILVKTQGWADEKSISSYDMGHPPLESFMERPQDITDNSRINASKDKAISYAQVNLDIDSIAEAIEANYGCILGIEGQNGGGWQGSCPNIPDNSNNNPIWRHWLYAGKCKMINGKKFIGVANSWGINVGDNGWQWLSEDFFNKQYVWEAWTIMFNPNEIDIKFKHTFNENLTLCDQNDEVKNLQTALQVLGYFPSSLQPTGYYGEITRKACYDFQVNYSVAPLWILWFNQGRYCGNATRRALNKLFSVSNLT